MNSLLQPSTRDEVWRRTTSLRPDTAPRWGQFTAPRMLAHMIQSLRMTSGDLVIPAGPAPWVLTHWPLKHLLIYLLPFPRGMSTFSELLARPAAEGDDAADGSWAEELKAFRAHLDVIGTMDPEGDWPDHGALGSMMGRQWGVFQYRHLDHHLRQFGL